MKSPDEIRAEIKKLQKLAADHRQDQWVQASAAEQINVLCWVLDFEGIVEPAPVEWSRKL